MYASLVKKELRLALEFLLRLQVQGDPGLGGQAPCRGHRVRAVRSAEAP